MANNYDSMDNFREFSISHYQYYKKHQNFLMIHKQKPKILENVVQLSQNPPSLGEGNGSE